MIWLKAAVSWSHVRSDPNSKEIPMALGIDIISDVVCPWCFIGKRRLESALELYRARRPDAPAPAVIWHPFQLNPDMPPGGVDRNEYVKRKFGADRAGQVYGRVTAVGREVGIPFDFTKLTRQPNTLAAHSLIALAIDSGQQDAMVEALFVAFFLEGKDLTSPDTLAEVAVGAGLDAGDVKAFLEERMAFAIREGVAADRILLDPGIGFGKTVEVAIRLGVGFVPLMCVREEKVRAELAVVGIEGFHQERSLYVVRRRAVQSHAAKAFVQVAASFGNGLDGDRRLIVQKDAASPTSSAAKNSKVVMVKQRA